MDTQSSHATRSDAERIAATRYAMPADLRRAATVRTCDAEPLRESDVEALLIKKACHAKPQADSADLADRPSPSLFVPSPGRIIAGKYKLLSRLASGGMGCIWAAHHLDLDIPVAVKLMALTYTVSTRERSRFLREARAAARLRSRNVVTVLDYGVDRGAQYIVMERLDGEDLGERLERRRRMSVREAGRLLDALANALELAHGAGIVHRDLKPENVFLARVAGEPEEVVKVLDFGVAKELRPSSQGDATGSGVAIGTPHYMSPEQANGSRSVDHRSDLWSVGVLLFRALTGRLPFEESALVGVLDAILHTSPPAPSSVAPHLSVEVDRFFARALAPHPSARFSSIREMADAFRELPEGGARSVARDELAPKKDSDPALATYPFEALNVRQLSVWACGRTVAHNEPALFSAAPATDAPVALEPAMSSPIELGGPAPRARRAFWIACALAVLAAGLLVALLTRAAGA